MGPFPLVDGEAISSSGSQGTGKSGHYRALGCAQWGSRADLLRRRTPVRPDCAGVLEGAGRKANAVEAMSCLRRYPGCSREWVGQSVVAGINADINKGLT
jgi:hypothetical protein